MIKNDIRTHFNYKNVQILGIQHPSMIFHSSDCKIGISKFGNLVVKIQHKYAIAAKVVGFTCFMKGILIVLKRIEARKKI